MNSSFAKVGMVLAMVGVMLFGLPGRLPAQENADRDARLNRLERQVHQLVERQEQSPARLQPGPTPPMAQQPMKPMCWNCASGGRCPVGRIVKPLLLVLAIIHIMLAVWVFTDIRKRGEGSGIFIVLALLAGIPGTILYALIRIGDRVGEKKV